MGSLAEVNGGGKVLKSDWKAEITAESPAKLVKEIGEAPMQYWQQVAGRRVSFNSLWQNVTAFAFLFTLRSDVVRCDRINLARAALGFDLWRFSAYSCQVVVSSCFAAALLVTVTLPPKIRSSAALLVTKFLN